MPFSQLCPQSQSLQEAFIWLAMTSSNPTRLRRIFQYVHHLCEKLKPSSSFTGPLGFPSLPDPIPTLLVSLLLGLSQPHGQTPVLCPSCCLHPVDLKQAMPATRVPPRQLSPRTSFSPESISYSFRDPSSSKAPPFFSYLPRCPTNATCFSVMSHCPLCFLTTACICPQLFKDRHGNQTYLVPRPQPSLVT